MPPITEARFDREMGCTPEELRSWIPGACGGKPMAWGSDGVAIELGANAGLTIRWVVLPPRRIALITLPRLMVTFDFGTTSAERRESFMRHFDLYTHRGGG